MFSAAELPILASLDAEKIPKLFPVKVTLKLPVGEPFVVLIDDISKVSTDHVSERVPAFIPNVSANNLVLCMPPENLDTTELCEIHLDDCEDVLAVLTCRVGKITPRLLPLNVVS